MTNMTLEERVAALERIVLEQHVNPPSPLVTWLASQTPLTDAEEKAFDDMLAYAEYFRTTGRDAPQDWNPGDPIPEPDEDWCPR